MNIDTHLKFREYFKENLPVFREFLYQALSLEEIQDFIDRFFGPYLKGILVQRKTSASYNNFFFKENPHWTLGLDYKLRPDPGFPLAADLKDLQSIFSATNLHYEVAPVTFNFTALLVSLFSQYNQRGETQPLNFKFNTISRVSDYSVNQPLMTTKNYGLISFTPTKKTMYELRFTLGLNIKDNT